MSAVSVLKHAPWFSASKVVLATLDGRAVSHWKFNALSDKAVWSAWARHFRSQYISDDQIDVFKAGTPFEASRAGYLTEIIFPDAKIAPGPSTRSGDFCEILIADLLESNYGYYIPRTRYQHKAVRNESPKGSDVIAIKFEVEGRTSVGDVLAIYEVKGALSGEMDESTSRLQDAVNDSCKDDLRCAYSLDAAKRRLIDLGRTDEALVVQRFQNAVDTPYTYRAGAAAVLSSACWNPKQLEVTDCSGHPHAASVHLLVVEADDFMALLRDLYRLAADEA